MSTGPGKVMRAIREIVVARGGRDVTSHELASAIYGPDFTVGQVQSVRHALHRLPAEWNIRTYKSGRGYGSGAAGSVLKAFHFTEAEEVKLAGLRASVPH